MLLPWQEETGGRQPDGPDRGRLQVWRPTGCLMYRGHEAADRDGGQDTAFRYKGRGYEAAFMFRGHRPLSGTVALGIEAMRVFSGIEDLRSN